MKLHQGFMLKTVATIICCAFSLLSPAQSEASDPSASKTELLCIGEKRYTDIAAQRILGEFSRDPVQVSISEDMKSAVISGFTPRFRTAGKDLFRSAIAAAEPYEITATDEKIYHISSSTNKQNGITEISTFKFSLDRRTGDLTLADEVYSINTNTWERSADDKVIGAYRCARKQQNIF